MAASDNSQPEASVPAGRWFATTHWTVVLAAGGGRSPGAAQALEQLCSTYWYPLYAFVRREGYGPEDAQDLTQGFFARVLEKNYFSQVNRDKGRFRSFLLASLRHFLSDERDRARAIKRGGTHRLISLDAQEAEDRFHLEPVDERSAEKIFERRWALTLLDAARTRLREEYAAAGKAERFALLQSFIPGEQEQISYGEAAGRLGLAAGTVKWEVHQLKQKYGELLRAEIAHTVSSPDQIEEEVRHLIAVLSS